MSRLFLRCVLLCCTLLLVSCGGGGGGSTSGLTIYLTDAPIDGATSVKIGLVGAEVQGSGGIYDLPTSQVETPDFYQLQGGVEGYLIVGAPLPAGNYQSISLNFRPDTNGSVSSLTLADGTVHQIYIPTGDPTIITVPFNFTMPANGNVNITLDLDLRKSLIQDPNDSTKYILHPVLRAVNNNDQGNIGGTISYALFTSNCSAAVYIYSGNVTPNDVDINSTAGTVQPITSALPGLNVTTGQYNFSAGFLPPGKYTVAFTCDANKDNPSTADAIQFLSVTHTTVSNGSTAVVNLN